MLTTIERAGLNDRTQTTVQSMVDSHYKDNKVDLKITVTKPLAHCDSHTLVSYSQVKAPEQLKGQTELVNLNMPVLATATQPINEIDATTQCNYHCYRDTSFCVEGRGHIQGILHLL